MHVKIEVSVVKAIDFNGLRSFLKRPTNSAAICWLSAALPPFPHQNIVPPNLSDFEIISEALSIFFSVLKSVSLIYLYV